MEWDEIEPCRGVREMFRRLDIYEGVPLGVLADNKSREKLDLAYKNNVKPWNSLKNWHARLVEDILGVPSSRRHPCQEL